MKEESQNEIHVFLAELREGSPGINPTWGGSLAEAAAICLESQKHANITSMVVDGDYSHLATLEREEVNDQMRRTWNDHEVATELGAYGIAALLIRNLSGLCVVERSKKGTGFDYWLGDPNDDPLFQGKARMEVSGILKGSESAINGRINKKLKQTSKSDGELPAVVVVVEFSRPLSRVVNKCKK